uniref:Uncharacterized protein n=1 Tax=Cacopsylla melanoneura TaxID=428564 RepID=A0A8D9ES58_9HEMI
MKYPSRLEKMLSLPLLYSSLSLPPTAPITCHCTSSPLPTFFSYFPLIFFSLFILPLSPLRSFLFLSVLTHSSFLSPISLFLSQKLISFFHTPQESVVGIGGDYTYLSHPFLFLLIPILPFLDILTL